MSKAGKKRILSNQNEYVDRQQDANNTFATLTLQLQDIDSMLLLLNSKEEVILIALLKHITECLRKSDENIKLLKEKNVLDLMLEKQFNRLVENLMIKRLSLYLVANIVESMNTLVDLEEAKTQEIIKVCWTYYVAEQDDICLEYISVVLSKCLDDPKLIKLTLVYTTFLEKFLRVTAATTNPDVMLHSLQILRKMLLVLTAKEMQQFFSDNSFPIDKVLCELTSDFEEIRKEALQVTRIIFVNINELTTFFKDSHKVYVLEQLIKLLCDRLMLPEINRVADVLALAFSDENMAQLFFELNHFESYMQRINEDELQPQDVCKTLAALCELAKYDKYLPRLVKSEVMEILLNCFLNNDQLPSLHILLGLNRIMKNHEASLRLLKAYELGLLSRLIDIIVNKNINVRIREEATSLVINLLAVALQKTAEELFKLPIAKTLAYLFGHDVANQSIDLQLSLLNIIELLSANAGYCEKLFTEVTLIKNIGILLMNSFSTAILVSNIFRCLCTIIDVETTRCELRKCHITSSLKRALKSLSNVVKASATNFIMQTTRYPEFLCKYIDNGVLEVLIIHQKHAYCVATWKSAIESILSKTPTMKFCIRNHLSFTDLTNSQDFFISKKKFEDFREFQSILKNDVSPLHPILIVNFERPKTPAEMVIHVPMNYLTAADCGSGDGKPKQWCYCRTPGDAMLPEYLKEVYAEFAEQSLKAVAVKQQSFVDFENIAQRAKILANVVANALSNDLKPLDLNASEECSQHTVNCHLKELAKELHCSFIPLGRISSGCQFERAVLFKALADQVGLPCTLQRSVDGRLLFNELPMPLVMGNDSHCDAQTMKFMLWSFLKPTHIVDLMYNVGELYPLQSRQAMQYLRLC